MKTLRELVAVTHASVCRASPWSFKAGGLAPVVLMALVLSVGVTPALAVHNDGIFQLDGDVERGPSTTSCGGFSSLTGPSSFGGTTGCTGEDWNTLYSCTTGNGSLGTCSVAIPCDANGDGVLSGAECTTNHANAISVLAVDPAPFSIFTGGGSKDEKDITQWQWVDGSVPDKDDLIEAFAALYIAPPGTTRNSVSVAGHKILYFGANRLAVNGDAQIGFWFLQNPVGLGGTGQHASPFVDTSVGGAVSHKNGDVLILSNFVQGGGNSNIQVYVVNKITSGKCPTGSVEAKAGSGDICLTQLVNGTAGSNGVCNPATSSPLVPADAACAATNGVVVSALDPNFTAKSGAEGGKYPVVGFFEGGLDLTALGLGGECFPTFVVETRSSQSITAVLKDFTVGQFQRCFAEIATEIHDASENDITNTSVIPGTVIHDVAVVTGTAGGPDPGVGGDGTCTGARDCKVTFSRFASPDCSGTAAAQIADCVSNGNGSGSCTATSPNFTTQAAQAGSGYSYLAAYHGDSNYGPISLPSTSCEVVLVGKLDSTIATHIFQVSGTRGVTTCASPPTLTACEVTDNFIDISTTTPGSTVSVQDQAVVTQVGTGGPTPTGTVTFTRYAHADCSGSPTLIEGKPLDGTGNALSSVFALSADGLSYTAVYSGDNVYNASSLSRCEPVCAINSTIP